MAVTWKVQNLKKTETLGSFTKVVHQIDWTAKDSETVGEDTSTPPLPPNNYFEVVRYGTVALEPASSDSYIDYENITEANAIAWLKAALGSDKVTEIETSIASELALKKNPKTTTGVPW